MVFGSQSPKFGRRESLPSSFASPMEEEKQLDLTQTSLYALPETQVDSFEALRHTFRPQDDVSEKMQALVKSMAEPMVRNWLEKHMMGVVENLVRAEIERATRS